MRERTDAHANDECKMANDEWVSLPQIWAELGIPADYATRRELSPQPEATELIRIVVTAEGRELLLTPPAATAWEKMLQAAATDGIALQVVSAFRSIAYQAEIIRAKLARGKTIEAILAVNAAPGYSEHHTGRALDLNTPGCTPLTEEFAETAAFRWLTGQAARFGFHMTFARGNSHGIAFEPWHWCWAETNTSMKS
jgi:D-alanyl-D-alanine carboxypeptidase